MSEVGIGTSWHEYEGPVTVACKIIDKIKSSAGTEYFAVQKTYADGQVSRTQDLIRVENAEQEVALRRRIYEANSKSRADDHKRDTEAKAKQADELSLDGFAATLNNMQRGKAQKALLERGIRVNGKTYNKLRDAVRDLVTKGYVPDDKDHLINPQTEGWLKLGTFAVAYADFLIKNGKYK